MNNNITLITVDEAIELCKQHYISDEEFDTFMKMKAQMVKSMIANPFYIEQFKNEAAIDEEEKLNFRGK